MLEQQPDEHMRPPQGPPGPSRWLDRKENVTKVAWTLYVVCAVLVLLELVIHRHADVGIDGWFGFYAAYGFFGSVFLVMVAKQMRRVLKRPEDYYER
ncbi:MAG: uncharacterized membrane protein YhaH (DUF805 family) [Gammaproteobacteria bacterium]|jgi:uncharacterized membrane protein YhaH (DUF805 family)